MIGISSLFMISLAFLGISVIIHCPSTLSICTLDRCLVACFKTKTRISWDATTASSFFASCPLHQVFLSCSHSYLIAFCRASSTSFPVNYAPDSAILRMSLKCVSFCFHDAFVCVGTRTALFTLCPFHYIQCLVCRQVVHYCIYDAGQDSGGAARWMRVCSSNTSFSSVFWRMYRDGRCAQELPYRSSSCMLQGHRRYLHGPRSLPPPYDLSYMEAILSNVIIRDGSACSVSDCLNLFLPRNHSSASVVQVFCSKKGR